MLDAATAAGVIHLANFEFRHDAARQKVKTLIDQGAIGTPQHVHWSRYTAGFRTPLMPYGWLFDRERGGGWIGAYGSHVIDTLRWWIGDIRDGTGACRTDLPIRPDADGVPTACTAEDAFGAVLTFADGATATIDTASSAPLTGPQQVQVLGSQGVLTMTGTTRLVLSRPNVDDEEFTLPPVTGDVHEPSFTAWAELVRDAVRDGRQIEPSFRDGLACAEVMDRLRAGVAPP
jgi:predicted dehydrogenase